MHKNYYKPSEFADLIGIHINTLQNWDRRGILIAHRTPTNRRYYTHEQYEAYINGDMSPKHNEPASV